MNEQVELEISEPESQIADLPTTDEDAEMVKGSAGAALHLKPLGAGLA